MFIAIAENCSDPVLANFLLIFQRVLTILQIIVPIIAIIALTKTLIQLLANPDLKNQKGSKTSIRNWLLALIIFFMLPFIINFTMQLLDKDFEFASCWNSAKAYDTTNETPSYDNSDDSGQKTKLFD